MIYTEMTKKAMRLAYQAHHGQVDIAGVPYIFHPVHLAEQMEDEATATAALLHDVVEDTETTLEDLRREGFPEQVLQAVDLLTHKEGIPYLAYVKALKHNPVARAVKLKDLAHNSDITRVNAVEAEHIKYLQRYKAAFEILQAAEK